MKKSYFFFALIAMLTASGSVLQAQNLNWCYSDEMNNKSLIEHPEFAARLQQSQNHTQSYRLQNPTVQSIPNPIYIIPVVFHVIHEYGPENISDAQIMDELNILNRDYRKLNADTSTVVSQFQSLVQDAGIEFRLARKDPSGNCTTGIDRVVSPLTYNAGDNSKLNDWPNNKYLNVWIVNSIGASGVAGYAYVPSMIPSNAVDGILILHSYIGSIGTGSLSTSRALTHEIGHYLNLYHPWGATNQPGVQCGDDGVGDTPETMGWTSCTLTNNDICNTGIVENVQNYMEYSYCSVMFTNGQTVDMRAALNNTQAGRNNLSTTANLAATGTDGNYNNVCSPVADFFANTTAVCPGGTINYSWVSMGGHPTSWSWTFPGGTPATSTDSFPSVVYNTPGTYNVTMVVTNGSGNNTKIRSGYITVFSNTAMYSAWQFYEGFETTASLPSTDWQVVSDGGFAWNVTTSTYYSGVKCARLLNAVSEIGRKDVMLGPTINLTQISSPVLKFRVADAQRMAGDADKLEVYISVDCGQTWVVRYAKSGANLKTVPPTTSTFTPNSISQWRQESVNITPYVACTHFRMKFVFTSAGGNNIFIDDINIANPNSVDDFEDQTSLNIFPNPMNETSTISFALVSQQDVRIDMFDLLGRNVSTIFKGQLFAGAHQYEINKGSLQAGVYFIKLDIGGRSLSRKIVIE